MTPEQIKAAAEDIAMWLNNNGAALPKYTYRMFTDFISKHSAPSPIPASLEEAAGHAAEEIVFEQSLRHNKSLKHLSPILAQSQPGKDAMELGWLVQHLRENIALMKPATAFTENRRLIQAYADSQTTELRAQIADLESRLKAKAAAFGKSV